MPVRGARRLLAHSLRSHSARAAFFRFACVGVTIAMIDVAVLYLMKDLPGFNVYLARVVSYGCAMTAGYFLNRNFTFHHLENERHVLDELLRFFSVHALGGVLNFGVFSAVVFLGDRAELTLFWNMVLPLLGVWLGGVLGMSFNFLLSRKLVFDGAPTRH